MTAFGGVLAAVLSFIITSVLGIWMIPFLKRLKFGQSIREIGPTWHKAKQGTPVMGGLMFITGIVVAVAAVYLVCSEVLHVNAAMTVTEKAKLADGIFISLVFGFIGFMDDYIKVVKKRNLGLTVSQKLVLQTAAAVVFLTLEYLSGDRGTTMNIPFTSLQMPLGVFYWPVSALLIVGMVNAVNLTDGIDGLCGSVTFIAAIMFMLAARIVERSGQVTLAAALAGGCLGFLVWNFHPAKIFMGDTGSLFLGGMVCALAWGIDEPLLLLPIGIIYLVEMFSVIIQVISFKTTGKRVFKMSPIHHHFELSGWGENKIVVVFSLVTFVCSAGAVFWLASYMGLF